MSNLHKAVCNATPEELDKLYFDITGKHLNDDEKSNLKVSCSVFEFGHGVEVERIPIIEEGLERSIAEEQQAIINYVQRAKTAYDLGDTKTASLYEDIMKDEAEHEFRLLGRKEE